MDSISFFWVNELQKGDHPIVDESGDAKKVVDQPSPLRSGTAMTIENKPWTGMKM